MTRFPTILYRFCKVLNRNVKIAVTQLAIVLPETKVINNSSKLRIAVVWTEVPGYLSACLETLYEKFVVDLLVVSNLGNRPLSTRRAFNDDLYDWMPRFHRVQHPDYKQRGLKIRNLVRPYNPEVILLVFQWRYPETLLLAREAHRQGITVIGAMDNPWLGSKKQSLMAAITRSFNVLPLNAVWVPGERTAEYAKRLYGSKMPIWRGLYSADTRLFGHDLKVQDELVIGSMPARFLYAGRLSPEKGMRDLMDAYQRYRSSVSQPWELIVVGDGPLRSDIQGAPGVRWLGFRQPHELAGIMAGSEVFVLPSRYEPWGVVLHEATLSGMPIICSDACGASVELVQDGFNGLSYRAGNVAALTECLVQMSTGMPELARMGQNSAMLAQRYSTDLWANTLMTGIRKIQ